MMPTLPMVLIAVGGLIVLRMLYNIYRMRNMPPVVPFYALTFPEMLAYPLIGHATLFTNAQRLDELTNKYGRKQRASFWMFNRPVIHSSDGQLFIDFTGRKGAKHPAMRKSVANHLHTGVTDRISGDKNDLFFGEYNTQQWKRTRKFMHKAVLSVFSNAKMMDVLQEETLTSLALIADRARAGKPFMPHNVIKTMPLNYTMRLFCGMRYDGEVYDDDAAYTEALTKVSVVNTTSLTGATLINIAEELLRVVFSPSLGGAFPMLWHLDPICRATDKVNNDFIRVTDHVISEHQAWAKANPLEEPRDFVDIMLREVAAGTLPIRDVHLNLVNGLVAGTDTVSTWLEQYVNFMADHPHVLKRVQEEIEAAVGDRLVAPSDLRNLPYFFATLKEVDRVAGMTIYAVRCANADVDFEEYHIARDTVVSSSVDAIRLNPDEVQDPNNFNPDNFADDPFLDLTGTKDKVTAAFGGGVRVCVGARLAEQELLLYGANLSHCFSWRSPTGEKVARCYTEGIVRHPVKATLSFEMHRDPVKLASGAH